VNEPLDLGEASASGDSLGEHGEGWQEAFSTTIGVGEIEC
jgi:hypothetical protein